ncbi:MBL fold metallo-hydrolase [Clostridium sp. 'White wine YQ']|uniref:MBL fold metallo-hydrolase n=1 Tax=Clostridium sp. 'White wine YQ' TaxID=3027474 RepID=UPI0023661EA5|nr:MBL fold metallo-hydrolase [Clostridium sp. 'White wine YQ']MDD7793713.1 MBL fold metallo-hydrolase [Clostridium sp. 'White wine YQ']
MKNLLSKKYIKIPLGIIIYLIMFSTITRVTSSLTCIAFLLLGAYLFIKSDNFKKRILPIKVVTGILILFAALFFGIGATVTNVTTLPNKTTEAKTDSQSKNDDTATKETPDENKDTTQTSNTVSGNLKVTYIDVGQADSILIQQGTSTMLIDGGNNADGPTIKDYMDKQGITSLDYIIGTHAHEDHIGGLDYVINAFKIGKVYFPKTTSTTKTFEDFINSVKNKDLKLTVPQVGDTFNLGDATCTILAPNSSSYTDDNDYSIVVKVKFGNTSFLFDGDAQVTSEMEMVNKGLDLKADVLKIGHHGSKTSTCSNFLSAVNPKYSVISVGKDNSYGHPAQGTMDRLKAANVQVFRTDENGTIVATSNGTEITFSTQPGTYNGKTSSDNLSSTNSSSSTNNSSSTNSSNSNSGSVTTNEPAQGNRTVYWTSGGKSYHYDKNCRTLARSKNILEGPASSCPKTDPCNICVK